LLPLVMFSNKPENKWKVLKKNGVKWGKTRKKKSYYIDTREILQFPSEIENEYRKYITCNRTTAIHMCANVHSWITMLFGYSWLIFDIRNARVFILLLIIMKRKLKQWLATIQPV
jgi:hypothetical protein